MSTETKTSTDDHQYAFGSFVKNFDYEEESPNNLDNLALHVTKPGRNPGGAQSLIDHINELTDNDKRAAIEWNNGAVTFKLDSYKPELFGDNILRTYCRGPGHGMENADRFVNNGDVDHKASNDRTLGSSWYGVGQKNTAAAAAPFTLAMSVSKIEGDNYLRVHTHLFKMWGYHQTCTLQFDYYPDGPRQGYIECRSSKMLKRFVDMMQPTFLKTVDDIKNWIREEGNETGITRLMIGIRPKFKSLLVDNSTTKALVREMSVTYLHDPNFHVNICGQIVEPKFNIETLITDQCVYECDGYDVIVGRRKNTTRPAANDPFNHHKEPVDIILKGPVYVLGGRILQADSTTYMQGHYARYQQKNGLVLTKTEQNCATFPKFMQKCVPDDAMQCISFLYANRYANHAFNSKGEQFETMRIGTDLAIFVMLKSAERCTAVKNSVKTDDVVDINTFIDDDIFPTMPVFKSYHLDLYKKNKLLVLEEKKQQQFERRARKIQRKKDLEAQKEKKQMLIRREVQRRIARIEAQKLGLGQAERNEKKSESKVTENEGIVPHPQPQTSCSSSMNVDNQPQTPCSSSMQVEPKADSHCPLDAITPSPTAVPTIGQKRNRVDTVDTVDNVEPNAKPVPTAPRKKKRLTRKPDGPLSTVYLYTLEGSGDWIDEVTQQTIYRFGSTSLDPSEYFKEINRHHPTKKIKIVEYWTGVKNVEYCEEKVLAAVQASPWVQSYNATATSTNAFIYGEDEFLIAQFIEKQINRCGLTRHSIKFSTLG